MSTVAIRTLWRCFLWALLVLTPGFGPVSADELRLRDGSSLIGTIIMKDDGVLEFKTSFAGTIKVKWTEIKEIRADKPFKVMLGNDEILDLLHRIQNRKKAIPHKHDIAHRQQGDVRSLFRGYGMDYEESRRYQSGDDPRYMNWQLSARTGQHYMKVFREERQPDVFILVDRRSTMRFGTQTRLKITQAARAATIVALSAQQNNLSVGGVIVSAELQWFKTNRNKQAIFDFIHQLARPARPAFTSPDIAEPSLAETLKLLNEILISGSIIYLVSDFHDLNNTDHAVLLKLASRHQVNAIQISDPAEINLPESINGRFDIVLFMLLIELF